MWFWINMFLLFCWTATASKGQEAHHLLVTTKYGQLKGRQLTVKGSDRAVHGYFAIPFAKPPLGTLRFSPPEPAEPWDGVRDATAIPPVCIQNRKVPDMVKEIFQGQFPNYTISEDCLYLNIYTPAERQKNAKLPVMFWIHGGGLFMGGASMYDGSALSAYESVVMVSIQYRLGILGFFSTGDEHALGNWGFLDQVAALHWVQENIEDFGGDPDSVTIFGESAGGISVSALVVSPLAKGLFHKAISESGVSIMPGLICTNREIADSMNHMIANVTGCETTDSAAMVNCMRKKTMEEILKPVENMQVQMVPAVVDGVFFPKEPEELLAGKESNRVPFVIGVNNHESGWTLPLVMNMSRSDLERGFDRKTVDSLLQLLTPLLGSTPNFIDLVIDEYLGDTDDPILIRDSCLDMIGDITFVYPAVGTARYHRDSGLPVYFYEFQHRPSKYGATRPDFVKADHGDEVIFVFGGPFLDDDVLFSVTSTEEEKELSRTVMKYWANFARNGSPNGDGLPEWPVYGLSEEYLQISLQQKIGKQLKDDKMTFWSKRLPEEMNAIIEEKKQHVEL